MKRLVTYVALAMGIVSCAAVDSVPSSEDVAGLDLTCGGTEPFWSLDVQGRQATFYRMDHEKESWRLSSVEGAVGRPDYQIIRGEDAGSRDVLLTLRKTGACSDGMSDFLYTHEIVVTRESGESLAGCCGRIE